MTLRRYLVIGALVSSSAFAQRATVPAKGGDLCTPPPGSIAPDLPAKLLMGQGTVHFPITTRSAEAQKFFDQGIAQMHSFWAREAERSFLQAAELDPEAPMPWFGVAMVAAGDWRPKFQIDFIETAFGAPKRTRDRSVEGAEKAVAFSSVEGKATNLEKMYIAAVAARRDLKQKDPDGAFVQGMRDLLAKYPEEIEAKTYLALMLMRGFTQPDKKPVNPTSMEAVAILRELLEKAPEHPGVHHYVIHGFEGSDFAKDAWPSCRKYPELVPNIPHALHMPGHIWAQTGKWEEAVQSFTAAAKNERGYMAADVLYGNRHHGHNVHYLASAYSFEGQFDRAIAAGRELLDMKETPKEAKAPDMVSAAYVQGWFATLRALVQFEKWDELLKGEMLPAAPHARQSAWQHWALGLAKAGKGDTEGAKEELDMLDVALDQYRQGSKLGTPAELSVARKELEGHIAIAAGKSGHGLRLFEAAAREERALRYAEPPVYPRPVNEALGRAALKLGKLDLAERAFRDALEQYPGSFHAQSGLRATLQRANKPVEAGE